MSTLAHIKIKPSTVSVIRSWILEMGIKDSDGKFFSLHRAYEFIVEDFADAIEHNRLIYDNSNIGKDLDKKCDNND